ncbi:hypothetical protein C7271_01225 [filamentous cyanobacterium CCP5]|nr:hypothetical protein C7271_01225 [filamentous cyanobacterium CCP5]
MRMVMVMADQDHFLNEQVSFVLGQNYLLTVQEEPRYDCFGPIRDRIRYNKGAMRQRRSDYLLYTLLDAGVDGIFPVLECYGERIETLENEVTNAPTHQTLNELHQLKRELLLKLLGRSPIVEIIVAFPLNSGGTECHHVQQLRCHSDESQT